MPHFSHCFFHFTLFLRSPFYYNLKQIGVNLSRQAIGSGVRGPGLLRTAKTAARQRGMGEQRRNDGREQPCRNDPG